MVLDNLGKSLRESLRKIARAGYIDKETLDVTLREIQRALLSADVKVDLVFKLTETIKIRASEEKPAPGLSAKEHILHIVYQELSKFFGGKSTKLTLKEKKTKIMLLGLFGSGKTTTCAKLAKYLQKKGLKPCLIGTDVYRPAAFEQLKQLGQEINVPVFGSAKGDPAKIVKKSLKQAEKFDIIIVDSAGRDALDDELAKELKEINKVLKPDEKLLIMSADIGQKASDEANGFDEILQPKVEGKEPKAESGIDGVILTKMDSSAKGGGALSACASLGIPIKFVGLGEKTDAFETFNPEKFVSKMLGMGDLESLVKKTQEIFGKEMQKEQVETIMSGKFTLKDLYTQIQGVKKMGPLKKIFEMLPTGSFGIEVPDEQMQLSQEKMNKFTHIMDSMTPDELENPDLINASRVQRIAKGSGTKVEDVRGLLKHYDLTKKMVKRFGKIGKNKKAMEKLLKRFKGIKGFKM